MKLLSKNEGIFHIVEIIYAHIDFSSIACLSLYHCFLRRIFFTKKFEATLEKWKNIKFYIHINLPTWADEKSAQVWEDAIFCEKWVK